MNMNDTSTDRLLVNEQTRLKLGRGIRLQFDRNRETWTLMAPERVIVLNETAHEVISELLQSEQPLSETIGLLADRYDAPRDDIAADVIEMLQMFVDKKLLVLP